MGERGRYLSVWIKGEMNMTKRKLALAVALATVGSVWMGAASAAEKTEGMNTYELAPVEVEGVRTAEEAAAPEGVFVAREGSVGFLGNKDTMETPLRRQTSRRRQSSRSVTRVSRSTAPLQFRRRSDPWAAFCTTISSIADSARMGRIPLSTVYRACLRSSMRRCMSLRRRM